MGAYSAYGKTLPKKAAATTRSGWRLSAPSGSSRNPQCGDLNPVGFSSPTLLLSWIASCFNSNIHHNRENCCEEACEDSSYCLPEPLPGLSSHCLGWCDMEHRGLRKPLAGVSEAYKSESSTSAGCQSHVDRWVLYSGARQHRKAPPFPPRGCHSLVDDADLRLASGRNQPEMTFCSDC